MLLGILYGVLGVVAGVFGGMFGVGGGLVMVPALVLLFNFSQHNAQGTVLAAMVPPIGFLAAWQYYQKGHVSLPAAMYICAGFLIGGWLGGGLAQHIDAGLLKKIFGFIMIGVGIRMVCAL